MDKKPIYFAVYGTLKRGRNNNYLLGASEYLGTFQTAPAYTMFDGGYPVVERDGTTPITYELFKCNSTRIKESIFALEGCHSQIQHDPNNWYDFDKIETPHGEAVIFVMDKGASGRNHIVNSGNWKA